MASSFIDFNNFGFWTNDGLVETFQLLLFEEINNIDSGAQTEWLNAFKKDICLESLPLIYGGMSMHLDEYLFEEERKSLILKLIENIEKKILTDNEYLTEKHLNLLKIEIRHFLVSQQLYSWENKELENLINETRNENHLPNKYYLRGLELLKKLILGQLKFKTDTQINYWD